MSAKPINPASPLPWEYDSKELRRERSGYGVLYDATGKIICDTMNSDVAEIHQNHELGAGLKYWDETGRVDLLFAMRAANCHHKMLAALKAAERAMAKAVAIRVQLTGITTGANADILKQIQEAIAEAEGTP